MAQSDLIRYSLGIITGFKDDDVQNLLQFSSRVIVMPVTMDTWIRLLQDMTGEGIHEEDNRKQTTINGPGNALSPGFLAGNLTHIRLSGSGLSQLPNDLCPSEIVVEVDLSRNRLKEVPERLSHLRNLRHLNLSCNELSKVPEALYQGLHVLKSLNLSCNKLVTFQRVPLCLPILQFLDLSGNKLVAPPPWLLSDLPASLEHLDLSNNPCFLLSPRHTLLQDSALLFNKVSEKVKTLRLVSCGLRGAINEKYIENFKNIEKLDVGNTGWENISTSNYLPDISKLPKTIQELSICGAGAGCLPKSVATLTDLRKLDISHNSIHWLPPPIGDLKMLTILRADFSKIYLLPPEINLLTNLKQLYLSHNELSSSDGFESLASLEVLDLYQNQFISVPEFKYLTNLRALDFCQNFIDPPELVVLEKKEVVPYNVLRDCLRLNHYEGKLPRLNGAKEFPVIPELEDERFSNFSDHHESSFNLSDLDDEISSNNDKYSDGNNSSTQTPPEIWEVDTDDYYDPNVEIGSRTTDLERVQTEEELTGHTSHEVRTHPHYFIPFRTASPAFPPDQFDPPTDGQFEDQLDLPVNGQFDD